MADISCSQIIAEYYAAKQRLMEYLAIPLAMVDAAERLVSKAVGSAADLLADALGLVDGSIFTLPLADMISSLYRLLDCIAIASSSMGSTIAAAIDSLEDGLGLPEEMVDLLKSQAGNYMGDAMDSVTATPYGKLAELDGKYRDLMNNSAVTGAMSTLQAIEQCLEELCEGYDTGEFSYANIKERVGAGVDNTVTGVTDAVKGVPENVKTSARTFSDNYQALKTSVSTKTFTIST